MKYLNTVIIITLTVTSIISCIFSYLYYEMGADTLTEIQKESYNIFKVLFLVSTVILLWFFILFKIEEYKIFKKDNNN